MWELDHFELEGLIIYEHHWYYVLFAGGSKCILGNKLGIYLFVIILRDKHCPLLGALCIFITVSPYIWGKRNNCQIKVWFSVNFLIFSSKNMNTVLRCKKKKKKINRNNPEKFSKLQNTSSPCRPQLWPNKLCLLHTVALISWGRFERAAGNHVELSQISRLESALLDKVDLWGGREGINHFEMKCVTERPPGFRAASEKPVGCSELWLRQLLLLRLLHRVSVLQTQFISSRPGDAWCHPSSPDSPQPHPHNTRFTQRQGLKPKKWNQWSKLILF